mgnify:CR=1 FL=1
MADLRSRAARRPRGSGRPHRDRLRTLGGALTMLLVGVFLGRLLAPAGDTRQPSSPVDERVPSPSLEPEVAPRSAAARTPASAAREAARALSALADARLLSDRGLRRATVADIAVPSYRPELLPLFDRTYGYLADTLGRGEITLRMTPVGYRIEAYSARRASVAIWQVTLLGSAEREPIAAWATSRAELVWSGGRWRVKRFAPDTPGPTPAVIAPGTSTPPAEFVGLARGLRPLVP